jgi:putative transcriptional regulator
MSDFEKATFFERLRKGLQEGIAYSRGEINLKTTELPMPPPKAKAHQIMGLRKRLGMSQVMFAATLNVSPKTVQSWEQGLRQPADAALRMLQVIDERPQVIKLIFSSGNGTSHRSAPRRQKNVRQKVAV